jgi:hypothetical protein
MAITVSIGGVDKSSQIEWPSLNVEQNLTNQIDTCKFNINVYAGKTYRPTIGDAVLVSDGSTEIFGGTILKIDDSVDAGVLTRLKISCVSHEHTLDRYLAVQEFTDVSALYILNTLFDEFVNIPTKDVDTMESTETWVTEDGTVVADTTDGEFLAGDQSMKFTATASSTATARRVSDVDLTTFNDASAATTSDKIRFWVIVDNITNLTSVRIRFGNETGATYTNYYEATVLAADLVTGANEVLISKNAFSATGSPSWSTIKKRQYRVTASASGTVNVAIDDTRLVKSDCFTMGSVEDADATTSIKYNYDQVSDAITQLAKIVGCDWYVDPDKVLHFFAPETEAAPFGLTDTSDNFFWNSLSFVQDLSTLKNQIIVRGGEYQGNSSDFDQIADGTSLNYRSPYKIKNIAVTVDSVSKTVGVDNLDDPADYDCLYNFQEKNLKFKTATKPAATKVVRMSGNPVIPVIIKRGDATSITTNGVYEFLIIDKSIVTQQGARDRAAAELSSYRDALVEGKFTTDTSGLRAGQTISVAITARDIDETYIIKSVSFRARTYNQFFYDVKLVSTRSFGIIEYLLGLLRKEKKQIDLNDDEVIDLVQDINETVTITDTWAHDTYLHSFSEPPTVAETFNSQLDHGTTFVYAPYTHSSFSDTKRAFILDGSPLAAAVGSHYLLESGTYSYLAEDGSTLTIE